MSTCAVIARPDKELGGGLDELRQVLAEAGVADPEWRELPTGSDIGDAVREVVEGGAELLFVWGGDGTVQRCVDAIAGSDVAIAILPAGGGNLLARDLGVPLDVRQAVAVGLNGGRRRMDTVVADGEHFAIVAGAGLSSVLMRDHDKKNVRERTVRVVRLCVGAMKLRARPIRGSVTVDGRTAYAGTITCVLVSNIAQAVSGIEQLDESRADDGMVEIGVVGSRRLDEWARSLGRIMLGRPEPAPLAAAVRGEKAALRFNRAVAFELDGSPRDPVKKTQIVVRPRSLSICVPMPDPPTSHPNVDEAADSDFVDPAATPEDGGDGVPI